MNDNLIGKSLGQFEIIEEIGRGGMATVYRARQTSINRIVAIKVLPSSLLHDPTFYERFTREVDVVAHLEHPHILPIYDYGEADGIPYIAMRYLAGGSMAQWIRRGLPPLAKLVKPVEQIAMALDYAHQQGIIHRDLKPGNVLLDENDNAYLSDFGIARVLDSNLTGSAIIGTPAYMSPEQANGLPLDARSDIYSLGVVLFELVTGREPFEAETPVALLLKHINEPIPSVRGLRPELPAAAEAVIIKATAKRPDDRYPSGSDMAQAFAAGLHEPNTVGVFDDDASKPTIFDPESLLKRTPTGGIERAPTPLAMGTQPLKAGQTALPSASGSSGGAQVYSAPAEAASVSADQYVERRINPALIIGVIVVLALVIIGGGYVITQNQRNVTPTQAVVMPTPFANAMSVRHDQYTISVPTDWEFNDLSDTLNLGVVHGWRLGNRAYFRLFLIDKSALGATTDFAGEVDTFDARRIRPQGNLHFLNADTAEDGSVRHSYTFDGSTNPDLAPGQTDFFYMDRAPYLAVVEMYASYAEGNDIVPIFQSVLESLRINPPSA